MDIHDPSPRCPICKTKFEYGICAKCGKYVKFYRDNRLVCKECYDTKTRTPNDNQAKERRRAEFFKEWCETIGRIPRSYPTLTEEQWLAAVKHFGRCAMCQDERIDARGYFIPFENGGRYCDWNIIPVCDKCAMRMKKDRNFFLAYNRPKGINDIVDYLEEKINAALARSTDAK